MNCPYCKDFYFSGTEFTNVHEHLVKCSKRYVDRILKVPTRRNGKDRRKKDMQSVAVEGSPFEFYIISGPSNLTVWRCRRSFMKDRRQS